MEKILKLIGAMVEYGQNSNIPIVHRFFSESPELFKKIVLYGTSIAGVITILLQFDIFPQYEQELKYILSIAATAVSIASITKKDKTNN